MDSGRPVEKLTLVLDAFKLDIPPEGEEALTSSNSLSSRPPSTVHDGSAKSIPTEKTSPAKAHSGRKPNHLLIDLLDDPESPIQPGPTSKTTNTSRRNQILAKSRGVEPTRMEDLMEKPPSTPAALEVWLHQKAATRQGWWNQELGIEEEEVSNNRITTTPKWTPQFITNPTSSRRMPPEPQTVQRKTITPPTFASRTKKEEKPERVFGGYGPLPISNNNYAQFCDQYGRPTGRRPRRPRRGGANPKASFIPQTNPRPRGDNRKIKTKRIVESSEDESGKEEVMDTKQRKEKEVTAAEEDEMYALTQEDFRRRIEKEEEPLIEL